MLGALGGQVNESDSPGWMGDVTIGVLYSGW